MHEYSTATVVPCWRVCGVRLEAHGGRDELHMCGEPSGENPSELITNVATVPQMPAYVGRTGVV